MGMRYRAEAFFGVVAERGGDLEKALLFFIARAGGLPAKTGVDGVEVSEVGSWATGETWVVARATGSAVSYGQGEDPEEPKALVEDPAWRNKLDNLFARLGVGTTGGDARWYFAGIVS